MKVKLELFSANAKNYFYTILCYFFFCIFHNCILSVIVRFGFAAQLITRESVNTGLTEFLIE